ncbi:MAG: outer membrane beta-barrel protein [Bacteroidota bacterium]
MVGISNPTDYTTASFEKKYFLAQFHAASSDGNISGYLNYAGGKNLAETSTSQFDLVLTGKITDKFSLGYNGTTRSLKYDGADKQSFWGSALYVNYDPSEMVGLTLRGELFDDKKGGTDGYVGTSVFATTLSAGIKINALTIIPEFRLDSAKDPIFVKNSGDATKSSASFILAAVLAF